jgi:transcriptional regulator with XRE-family HTH domain
MHKRRSSEDKFSDNLRYLLWRRGIDRERWALEVVSWLDCSPARAADLLTGATPSQRDVDELSRRLGVTPEELRFTTYLDDLGGDLLIENLRYLADGIEHGVKKKIAEELGVHATSLSRWLAGTHRPDKRYRSMLASHFGLQSELELTNAPLFLSLLPVSENDRKRWLRSAVDELDHRRLNELFPALHRLLS